MLFCSTNSNPLQCLKAFTWCLQDRTAADHTNRPPGAAAGREHHPTTATWGCFRKAPPLQITAAHSYHAKSHTSGRSATNSASAM